MKLLCGYWVAIINSLGSFALLLSEAPYFFLLIITIYYEKCKNHAKKLPAQVGKLTYFFERMLYLIQNIPSNNITVVFTAAVRMTDSTTP